MKPRHAHRHYRPPSVTPEHPAYCPACFALIDADTSVCPFCDHDLMRLSGREYRDKLLAALNHPLADVRLRAIIALGWRGEGETAEALARCALHHPVDIVEGLQVVESLRNICDKAARRDALRMLAQRHPARVVRLRTAELSMDDSWGAIVMSLLPDAQRSSTISQESSAVFARAARYLRGRQSPQGGFCFYRTAELDEPSLFDTYHAVAALALLGDTVVEQGALLRFVRSFPSTGQLPALYYRAFILQHLARPDLIERNEIRRLLLALPAPGRTPLSSVFRGMFETVRLKRLLGGDLAAPAVVQWIAGVQREGGFGKKPNLLDTRHALHVLTDLDGLKEAVASAARDFVDALQVPTFGFTVARDSLSSSLEIIHAGVQCCRQLGLPVRYPREVQAFVVACQTSDGGMSRVPGALPEIESTHYGIAILRNLGGNERRGGRTLKPGGGDGTGGAQGVKTAFDVGIG